MTTRETELLAANAALELEVVRLREALEFLNARIVTMDLGGVVERALSTPFTPQALNELIEKVEKMTIERCAQMFRDSVIGGRYLADQVRTISTGQIKLEELL